MNTQETMTRREVVKLMLVGASALAVGTMMPETAHAAAKANAQSKKDKANYEKALTYFKKVKGEKPKYQGEEYFKGWHYLVYKRSADRHYGRYVVYRYINPVEKVVKPGKKATITGTCKTAIFDVKAGKEVKVASIKLSRSYTNKTKKSVNVAMDMANLAWINE